MDYNKIEQWIADNGGQPDWKAIAIFLGMTAKDSEKIRQKYKHFRKKRGDFATETPKKYKATYKIDGDGVVLSDRVIAMSEEDSKTPRRVIELHGFDPDEWVLIDVVNNFWQMMKSHKTGGGTQNLYQSKIRLRPRNPDEKTIEDVLRDIDIVFENYTPPKMAPAKTRKEKPGFLLEADIGDIHIDGTNNDNIEARFTKTIGDLEQIAESAGQIDLVLLGDTFHYDTPQKTTSNGTKLDTGGLGHKKMFDLGLDLAIFGVERLSKIAPVYLPWIPGNHDEEGSYKLFKAVEAYFRKDESVIVDCGHHPQKARLFGVNLICYAHGEMNRERLLAVPQTEFRELFGKAMCVEIHVGHLHSQSVIEKGGVFLRYLPALANISNWEIKEGYGGLRGSMAYKWREDIPGYVANYQIRPE